MLTQNDDSNYRQEVTEAALQPILNGGRWFWPIIALLALPVLAALGAWGVQLARGLQVTGLSNRVFWGIYTANLVTFIGLSYGGALVSAILRLTGARWRAPITRLAEATALITMMVGAGFVFFHLGRPDRLWEFLVSPNGSSPLVWDATAMTTYLAATLIFLYLPMIPDMAVAARGTAGRVGPLRQKLYRVLSLGWRGTSNEHTTLNWAMTAMAVLIIPIAVTVHSVLSWAFSMTTREGWHSTIFGPYFVVAALFSGVAMVILVVLAFRKAYNLESYITEYHITNLGYIMITNGLIYLYFTFSEILTEIYPVNESTGQMLHALLLGTYSPWFWGFVVGGGIIPVLLVALPWTRRPWGIGTASVLVVIALAVKRFLIVVPPESMPLVSGPTVTYTPSIVELLITFGALAAIPLLLMLFFRVFPILSVMEMNEAAGGEAR